MYLTMYNFLEVKNLCKKLKKVLSMLLVFSLILSGLHLGKGELILRAADDSSTFNNLITNGNFDSGLDGWISVASGSAITIQGWGASNTAEDPSLSFWLDEDYTANIYQTVTNLEAGTYELSAYIYNDGAEQECYMYAYQGNDIANKQKCDIIEATNGWKKIIMTIELPQSTDLTIGFYKDSPADGWCKIDNVVLVKKEVHDLEQLVINGGFDDGLKGWTISEASNSSAVLIQGNGPKGADDLRLSYWAAEAYIADTYQTITSLAAGTYELSAYIYNDGAEQECYMYAYIGSDIANMQKYYITEKSSGWNKIYLTITLYETSNITIGFYKDSPAGGWCGFDDVTLTRKENNEIIGVPIINGDFEHGALTGWTFGPDNTDGATFISDKAHSGSYGLSTWSDSAYISDIYQDITGVEPGYYYLTAYVQNSGGQNYVYLYGAGSNQSNCTTYIPVSNTWTLVTVRGIEVTEDGYVRIGLYSNAKDGNWTNIDNIKLIRESNQEKQYKFYKGGDVSFLNYMEDHGAKYYDQNGVEKDALQILAEKGWNIVRLRLYNNPGKGRGDGTYYCHENYQTVDDLLDLAKRAKEKGMAIQFTFHYSDYWSNGATQYIPYDWQLAIEGKSEEEAVNILESYMYSYTKDIMERLDAQGTVPEFVSFGNEMHAGILFPYGAASSSNWPYLARFLNAAYRAVKEVSPATQVILHLDDAGNLSKYTKFFDNCNAYGVNYDIIGPSYYPFWTNLTVAQIVEFCNTLVDRYDKDIMIMETGYNFSDRLPNGSLGQLNNNGPYDNIYPSSPENQRNFMLEVFNGLKSIKDGRCIGDLYWDPIMVEQPGVGWAYIEETDAADVNVVSNTTVFGFDHKALPVLDVYEYNNEGTNKAYLYGKITGANSSPINKAYIQIGTKNYEVITDAYGYFYLAVDAQENATVSVNAPGYINGNSYSDISLSKGEKVNLNFTTTGGSLSGKVLDQDNSPVAGALVTAYLLNQTYIAVTNSDGYYIMHDLPAGNNYIIKVTKAGYEPSEKLENIEINYSQITTDCNFVIHINSGTISGRVVDDAGAVLPGATVTAVLGDKTYSTLTDVNGEYILQYVTAGENYIVTASKENYISSSLTINLEIGELKNQVNFTLYYNGGNIKGTVKDGNGLSVSNATVELTSGKYTFTTTANTNGEYEFTGIPARTYKISATKNGLMKAELTDIEVRYLQTNTVNLTMPVFIDIVNGSFEEKGANDSIPYGWDITDTTSAFRQDRTPFQGTIDGRYALSLWSELPFETSISQTLVGLENGKYVISIQSYANISKEYYMYAKDSKGNIIGRKDLDITNGYRESILEVTVTDNVLTIGFYANASGGEWAVIDMVQVGFKGKDDTIPSPTPSITPAPTPEPTPNPNPDNASTPTLHPTPVPSENITELDAKVSATIAEDTQEQTINVSINISQDVIKELSNTDSSSGQIMLTIPLVSKELIKLMKDDNYSSVSIKLTLPDIITNNAFVAGIRLLLDPDIITSAKENEKNIYVIIKDEKDSDIYSWYFSGKDLAASDNEVTELDLSISLERDKDNHELAELLGSNSSKDGKGSNILVLNFGHNGKLPAQASVRVYVGNMGYSEGDRLYLYYYNSDTNKLVTLPYSSKYFVDAYGYITINILHCSKYVLMPKQASSRIITSLRNQINIEPDNITLFLGSNENSKATVKVTLPETLEQVKNLKDKTSSSAKGAVVITYKSGNKKVATVDDAGNVVAKKTGKADIIVEITLYSGKKKTVIIPVIVLKQ